MTSRSLKQVTVAAAKAAGYLSPGRLAERLPALEGEFRRSPSEALYKYGLAALFVGCGGLVTGLAVREYITNQADGLFYFLGALAAFLFSTAIYVLTRIGIWYKIQNGAITALRSDGRTIWTESLSGLSYVTLTAAYGFVYMTLRWRDRKRRLEVYDSLRQALNASAS